MATAWGFLAASEGFRVEIYSQVLTQCGLLLLTILHELSKQEQFAVKIVQAEDEIASVCMAMGASFTGSLSLTTTSSPGLEKKSEAIGFYRNGTIATC